MKHSVFLTSISLALLLSACASTTRTAVSAAEAASATPATLEAETVVSNAAAEAADHVSIDSGFNRSTTHDADAAATLLGTACKKFIRADQCVIAFFDKNDQRVNRSKNATYYRVIYGKVNDLYVGQDFFTSGQKQSNVYFARSEEGLLNSFYTDDMAFEGNITGYTLKGKQRFSVDYHYGQLVSMDADSAATAGSKAVDAAKAAAEAVKPN